MGYVAADIMSKDVICISKDTDLRDLAKMFLSKGITGAPVMDAHGDLCGVISQTDLLYYQLTRDDELVVPTDFYANVKVEGRTLAKGFQIEDVNTATVEEVMTPVVHAVPAGASIEAVARLMTRRHIHRVIVRRGRKVVGIISALDVLRVIAGHPSDARAERPRARRKAVAPPVRRRAAKAARPRKRRAA
jgi:CBS domain-containing protein